ncbi:MAG TPA: TIGR03560 family F420-dependent LLM class oxidoreductase [Candidatus Xenobia bacterium]|jgi:F420-dependent oxidoreductase-like protein
MNELHYGVSLWPQYATWPEWRDAALRVETLGYDSVWAWDHFLPIIGDPAGPNLECWQLLPALAALTKHVKLGALVSGNTYRQPPVLAKMAATLDHISNGRAIVGMGAAWFELEHKQYGIDFGKSPGDRIAKLGEALPIMRSMLDQKETTLHGKYYQVSGAWAEPKPVQKHLPIMIGGGGEQKTLRLVAKYADYWNGFGTPDVIAHKLGLLKGYCQEAGTSFDHILGTVLLSVIIRDKPQDVEARAKQVTTHNRMQQANANVMAVTGGPEQVAQTIAAYAKVGLQGILLGGPPPYDMETLERFQKEVRPRVRELLATAGKT